jgi:hypothetical protein
MYANSQPVKFWQTPTFIKVNSNVIFSFEMTTCNSANRQNAIGTGLDAAKHVISD